MSLVQFSVVIVHGEYLILRRLPLLHTLFMHALFCIFVIVIELAGYWKELNTTNNTMDNVSTIIRQEWTFGETYSRLHQIRSLYDRPARS